MRKNKGDFMKIALINENSQASKNAVILKALKKVVEPMGFEVVNYGMYSAEDKAQLTYVQNGILAATLLNSGACDYVITGCGTGEGAMLALNSFPGVICGHVATPLDAYTFAQINDGNAISIPFALGFGWGGDLNLEYIFAPSRVPRVTAPFTINFILLVPEASLPAVEICSETSEAGKIFSATVTL